MSVDLRGLRIRPITPSAPLSRLEAGEIVGRALDNPADGSPLEIAARDRRSATLIVPDATRKVPLPKILPAVLERLRSSGVAESDTTVLVACGTHPAVGEDRLRELVGALPPAISVVQHESRSTPDLVTVGELRPGLPLRFHRAAVEADLLITIGSVRHHYFAGFGGGPKMVFPGVAGHEEIQANHALVLGAGEGGGFCRHPLCEPGRLRGNPVAEEIERAADFRAPDIAVCLVEGKDGKPCWAVAGTWRQAFAAAVERVRSWYEIQTDQRFEVLVASGGGAPSDSTLIQAHKGLDAACRFLVPGGELLYIAAIDEGAGSTAMLPFLEEADPGAILASLSKNWVQYGHTTLRILEKTSRFGVKLHSGLDRGLAERLGFEPVDSVQAVVNAWRRDRPGVTVGVMADGAVYPAP